MIFDPLMESAQRGELILVDGGFCHWHLRRDGRLTIREIIVLPERRGQGIGRAILDRLKSTPGAVCLVAKCPADLPANRWYNRRGFVLVATETTKTGRRLNVWQCQI